MKPKGLKRVLYYVFPLPAFCLGGAMLGIALWPAMLMVKAVYVRTAGWPDPLRLLTLGISCGFGYFVFGLSLLATIVAVKWISFIHSPQGKFSMFDWKIANWILMNGMLMMSWIFFLQFTRASRLNVIFYRLLGMKIGKDVVIDTVHIYDVDLIEIGDETEIGGDAFILAHVLEAGHVYYKPVHIGARALIGLGAMILPGAQIGDGAVIGAHSLVTKDMVIPANTMWAGVPAKQIKDGGFASRPDELRASAVRSAN